jgi:hypothetical protein
MVLRQSDKRMTRNTASSVLPTAMVPPPCLSDVNTNVIGSVTMSTRYE